MKPTLETVELETHSFLRSLHCECRSFQDDHGWHYHPEFEIAFIKKGSGTRFIGDSVETFQAGELLLIGPNIPHCWVSDEASRSNAMQVLQFKPDMLGPVFWQLPELSALSQWLTSADRGIRFSGYLSGEILTRFQVITEQRGPSRFAAFL